MPLAINWLFSNLPFTSLFLHYPFIFNYSFCAILLRVEISLYTSNTRLFHKNFLEFHHSPALHLLLHNVRHITILFHTYNSFNGNFDGYISYPIYWSSLLDESCNSLSRPLKMKDWLLCGIESTAVNKMNFVSECTLSATEEKDGGCLWFIPWMAWLYWAPLQGVTKS